MVAKKKAQQKKKAKKEKAKQQALAHLSKDEAKDLIENLIDEGKPKEAIQTIQQLPDYHTPDFVFLKGKAYALRARQLEEKGLQQEATTVINNVHGQLSQLPNVACEQMAQLIRLSPQSLALNLYKRHMEKHPSCPWMERALGDYLVLTRKWDTVQQLSGDDPLRKDAPLMAEAMPELDEGNWQEGARKLGSISRKSPFSSWRWFSKAMVSASEKEEEALRRSLAQLPDDFPLRHAVRTLREQGVGGLESLRENVSRLDQKEVRDLLEAIDTRSTQLSSLITKLAHEIFPQHPEFAARSLSEMASLALVRKGYDLDQIARLLPSTLSKPLILRLRMFMGQDFDSRGFPFSLASNYVNFLDAEFSHVTSKKRVEAAIYFILLTRAVSSHTRPHMLHPQDRAALKRWLENPNLRDEDLFIALVEKVTRLAPDVAFYYKVLNLTEGGYGGISAEGKRLFEQALLRMQKQFPEDPYSYLQLARFYWNKGAYRKSQKILEDAWGQASYDPQVREEYGLGLLRAAVKARNRSVLHLATKDLEEAGNLKVEAQLPLVHAIRAVISYLEEGEKSQPVETLLALATPVLRYRALIYFYLDTGQLAHRDGKKLAQKASGVFSSELKKELDQLSGTELREIVAPIPNDYADLLNARSISPLLDPLWPKILGKLDDQQALIVYAELLGQGEERKIKWVSKDVQSRLRRQPDNVFLRFYSLLASHLYDYGADAEDFDYFIDSLSHEDEHRLREFCRKIAPYFSGSLFTALNTFNFFALEDEEDDFGFFDEFGDDDDDERELWEYEEELGDHIEDLTKQMEKLRGNKTLLRAFFEMLILTAIDENIDDDMIRIMGHILQEKAGGAVKALREIYSGKQAKHLGRKARLLLYPDE